jgi:hypothetical protein
MPIYTDYDEWSKNLGPCDILLFTKKGADRCINNCKSNDLGTHSEYVHVGVVCPTQFIDFDNKDPNETYILESKIYGSRGIKDIRTNKLDGGLQIRNLREIATKKLKKNYALACYKIRHNKFKYNLEEERDLSKEEFEKYVEHNFKATQLRNIWKNWQSSSYDWINCYTAPGFHTPELISKKNKKLFCSEFVIKLYQKISIIDTGLESESIGPKELGDWISDIMGDSPFNPDGYLLKKRPELNRQNTIHSKTQSFFIKCYWYWVVFSGYGTSKYNGSDEPGY